MAEPKVIQSIEAQRTRLQAHEAATMRDMARRWMGVEDALRADMLDLALYLDELRLKGETVSAARLLQMERYRSLIADARAQQEQYSAWAANAIAEDQRAAVAQGITDAQRLIEAAGQDARIASLVFDRINVSAVEFMAGFAADGSPLYDLLRASYPESVVALTDALVQGLAKGLGPRATAALMQKAMAGNLDRALLIARTEQLRALRAGNLEQMKQSKVVNGYIRRAQRNATVCPACLALDGTQQATADVFKSHPACCCFAQPVLKFGKTPSFPSGPEWLATQPESVQRSVLGPGKFELFKAGKLDWSQVAQVHNDPVWGPTIRQGTVSALRKSAGKAAGSDKIINGVRLPSERIGHILERHPEVTKDAIDKILRYAIERPQFEQPSKKQDATMKYVQDQDGKWWVAVVISPANGTPFVTTFRRAHGKGK